MRPGRLVLWLGVAVFLLGWLLIGLDDVYVGLAAVAAGGVLVGMADPS